MKLCERTNKEGSSSDAELINPTGESKGEGDRCSVGQGEKRRVCKHITRQTFH